MNSHASLPNVLGGFTGNSRTAWPARADVLATGRHVRCTYVEGAGCYGRNGHEDAADGDLLAKAVGKPVSGRARTSTVGIRKTHLR